LSENGEQTLSLRYHRPSPGSPVAKRERRYPLKQIMSPGFIFTTGQIPVHLSLHREQEGRSRRRQGTDAAAPAWFNGGASNHDTVKYIATLFIESNASENNHRRVSNDRGKTGDEIAGLPFPSCVTHENNTSFHPVHDAGIGLMRVFMYIVNRSWLPRKLRYRRYVRRARSFFLPPRSYLRPLFARVMSFPLLTLP